LTAITILGWILLIPLALVGAHILWIAVRYSWHCRRSAHYLRLYAATLDAWEDGRCDFRAMVAANRHLDSMVHHRAQAAKIRRKIGMPS
jgi:hypothetical protein